MTHRERVQANAQNISSLTADAITKLSADCFAQASMKMKYILGSSSYGDYLSYQNDPSLVNEIETEGWTFEEGTNGGRKLKALELAEAYCVIYYLSISLKQIDQDTVMTTITSFGEGSIKPDNITNVMKYGDKYLEEAKSLAISNSSDTGSISVSVI